MQAGSPAFEFGKFTLDPARRALSVSGSQIALSSRAFDVLQVLIEGRDRVLSKDEIITQVWRGVAVEENNLAVQISALRRALAEPGSAPLIATIPGHGYRFVGEVVERDHGRPGEQSDTPVALSLPAPVPEPVATHPLAKGRGKAAGWVVFGCLGAVAVGVASWRVVAPQVRTASDATAPPAPRLSLVVLPFRNLSGNPAQDYLADAISDDLTTDLSHIPASLVIARASSDAYKGRTVGAAEIGRTLHVHYLLEGSIRGADGMFRINAQLIDAATGGHLWADRFDVKSGRISDAQTDIVRHIASALNVTLVSLESQRSIRDRPDDPDAIDLFYRARSILNHDDTLGGFIRAQALLEQAIALQPEFAEALSELGWLLLTKINNFNDPDDERDHSRAKLVVERALALPPQHADALATQGFLFTTDDRNQEAIASYEAALAIDRNNIRARAGLGYCLWQLGHPEAAAASLREALRLDPIGPTVKWRFQLLGMALFATGRYDEAADWLHRSLAGDPDPRTGNDSLSRVEFSHLFLIAAYDRLGQHDQARKAYALYSAVWPHRSVWRLMTYATPQQAALPGFKALAAGLEAAGMPEFASEVADSQSGAAGPQGGVAQDGDFSPPPATIDGGRVIDAADVAALLKEVSPPRIIDVGSGTAPIPGAALLGNTDRGWEAEMDALLARDQEVGALARTRYVIMGTGPFGWQSYRAAARLIKAGASSILWFRGGEEAWARLHSGRQPQANVSAEKNLSLPERTR